MWGLSNFRVLVVKIMNYSNTGGRWAESSVRVRVVGGVVDADGWIDPWSDLAADEA